MLDIIMENIFFKLAVGLVAVFSVVTLLSANAERAELEEQREELINEIEQCEEELLSLKNDLSCPLDDEYIIRTARKKLNMRLPEEIVFFVGMNE